MKIRVEKLEIELDLPNIVEQVISLEMSRDAHEGSRVSALMNTIAHLADEFLKHIRNPPKRPDIKWPDLGETQRRDEGEGDGEPVAPPPPAGVGG